MKSNFVGDFSIGEYFDSDMDQSLMNSPLKIGTEKSVSIINEKVKSITQKPPLNQ